MKARGWLWAALALAAAGCGKDGAAKPDSGDWPDDGNWWQGGGGGASGLDGKGGEAGAGPDLKATPGLLADVRRILTDHCAPCHSGRENLAFGGFGDIFNTEAMRARGLVVPGDPDASQLYTRVSDDQMPPGAVEGGLGAGVVDPFDPARLIRPVAAPDKERLREWVAAGAPSLREAPRTPLTGAALRQLIADDVARLPEADRGFQRYVSLASASYGLAYLPASANDETANLVGVLFNSLSPARAALGRPSPLLDARGEVAAVRVDLRDYDLDAGDWARIEAAVDFVDRDAFPCAVPFLNFEHLFDVALSDHHVRADGRVDNVYSNIVLRRFLERAGVLSPGQLVFEPSASGDAGDSLVGAATLPQLASALGVDLAADIAAGGAAAFRACTQGPIVGAGERCIQRDAMPGGPGRGFWWSMHIYSFGSSIDDAPVGPANGDLAAAPAGVDRFSFDRGSALWPWPNKTMGYASFDDQLRLRSRPDEYRFLAPPDVDASLGYANCVYCHASGPIGVNDVMRPMLENYPDEYQAAEAEFVRRLFRPQAEIEAQLALDKAVHVSGVQAACSRGCDLQGSDGLTPLPSFPWGMALFVPADVAALLLFLDEPTFRQILRDDPAISALLPSPDDIKVDALVGALGELRRAAVAAGVDEAALNFCAVPAAP